MRNTYIHEHVYQHQRSSNSNTQKKTGGLVIRIINHFHLCSSSSTASSSLTSSSSLASPSSVSASPSASSLQPNLPSRPAPWKARSWVEQRQLPPEKTLFCILLNFVFKIQNSLLKKLPSSPRSHRRQRNDDHN